MGTVTRSRSAIPSRQIAGLMLATLGRLAPNSRLGWARSPGYSRRIGPTVSKGAVAMMAAETPTIVLVHGAFAESASWNDVIRLLLDAGYPAVALANPLRGRICAS